MKVKFDRELLELFSLIQAENEKNQEIYVVGGAVRDALLGRSIHDIDFAMAENPYGLAKRLAKKLKAGFFVLDDVRHTARVTYHNAEGNFFPLDFVQFTGQNLKQDLQNRDFTLNALAIRLNDLEQVVDPLNGLDDLAELILRCVSDHALCDDPVRVLRAIRFVVQYHLKFAPGMEETLKDAGQFLSKTSYERQRDEFFKILMGPELGHALALCRRLNIFNNLFFTPIELKTNLNQLSSKLVKFDHSNTIIVYFDEILRYLSEPFTYSAEKWYLDVLHAELGNYHKQINAYFLEEITPGRPKNSLAYFGALLHDVERAWAFKNRELTPTTFDEVDKKRGEVAIRMANQFQLSNAESSWVYKFVNQRIDLAGLNNEETLGNRRALYHYFKSSGEAGIGVAVYFLAEILTVFGENLSDALWRQALMIVKNLFHAWWDASEMIVSPTPLIDGFEMQDMFGIKPGKKIGKLLRLLVEEQASGTVNTTQEAIDFLRRHI